MHSFKGLVDVGMRSILPYLRLADRLVIHKSKPIQKISKVIPALGVFPLYLIERVFFDIIPEIFYAQVNLSLVQNIIENDQSVFLEERIYLNRVEVVDVEGLGESLFILRQLVGDGVGCLGHNSLITSKII